MKFKKLKNGDYEAIGEKGDFLLFKYGRIYKYRYWTKDQKAHTVLFAGKNLREAKKRVMLDSRWEK